MKETLPLNFESPILQQLMQGRYLCGVCFHDSQESFLLEETNNRSFYYLLDAILESPNHIYQFTGIQLIRMRNKYALIAQHTSFRDNGATIHGSYTLDKQKSLTDH